MHRFRSSSRIGSELTSLPEEEALSKVQLALISAKATLANSKNATALAKEALKGAGLKLKAASTSKAPPKKAFDAWEARAHAAVRRLDDLQVKLHTKRQTVQSMAKEARYLYEKGDKDGAKEMEQDLEANKKVLKKYEAAFDEEKAAAAELKKERMELEKAVSSAEDNHAPSMLAAAEKHVEKAKAALKEARRREDDAAARVAAAAEEVAAKQPLATAARKKFREEQKKARSEL